MDFGDTDPSAWRGGEQHSPAPASEVTFSRRELDRILRLYGRKVAAGEWRDYAIDFLKDRAVFLGVPPRLRNADLPDREEPETWPPPGRLQRDLGHRPYRAPRPRA